jgi:hypothetical protein
MLDSTIRTGGFCVGILLFLGGLVAISAGGPAVLSGIWAVGMGAGIMVVSLIQRNRYRSDAAERMKDDPGPGGGETGYLEPRFVPTNEVFADPTTRHLMRVYLDPRTGERRYRAER